MTPSGWRRLLPPCRVSVRLTVAALTLQKVTQEATLSFSLSLCHTHALGQSLKIAKDNEAHVTCNGRKYSETRFDPLITIVTLSFQLFNFIIAVP